MSCLRLRKTIKAHLIPRAFALEVRLNAGEKHVRTNSTGDAYKSTNTGQYDNKILCGPCDGKLGQYEGAVFKLLCKASEARPKVESILDCGPINGDTFVRFAAGIAWKYSVIKQSFGRLEIGPYSEVLKQVAFDNSSIPDSVDVTAIFLQDGSSDVYFYRTPMPDRQLQVNVVRFSVGGFVFFLKVDKRPNPSVIPSECWLKGKTKGAFFVARAEIFEEWTKHAAAREHQQLHGYFERMGNKVRW